MVNGKALERRTALAVSAWPAPLSPLGFSASKPYYRGSVTGLLGLSHAVPIKGVRHIMQGFSRYTQHVLSH